MSTEHSDLQGMTIPVSQPQRIGQAVSEIAADAEDGAPAGMGVEIDLRTYAPGTSVLCRCVESAE